MERCLAVATPLVHALRIRGEDGGEQIGTIDARRGAGVGDRAGGDQPIRDHAACGVERRKSARPPVAAPVRVGAELQECVDELHASAAGNGNERGRIEAKGGRVDDATQLFTKREQATQGRGVSVAHGTPEQLVRRLPLDVERLDALLEGRPVRETVLAREHELRVGESDPLLVRECSAHARASFRIATAQRCEQLLGELLLLLQIRARGERPAKRRHGNLLRVGRCPHIGPKEVNAVGQLRLGWAQPFPRTGGVPYARYGTYQIAVAAQVAG